MPRFHDSYPDIDSGKVFIERKSADYAEVFYVPSWDLLKMSGFELDEGDGPSVKLISIDGLKQSVTVYPVNTLPNPESFLNPKYSRVQAITIADWRDFRTEVREVIFGDELVLDTAEGTSLDDETQVMMVLESLPTCFIKDYDYGLGFVAAFRFIVLAIEELSDCTEIEITASRKTGVDGNGKIFYISYKDLDKVRKTINTTIRNSQAAARSVNSGVTRNFFAEAIGKPKVDIKTGRSPLRRSITDTLLRGESSLSEEEQEEVLNVVARNTKSIAKSKPEKLATLKKDIELVTLDGLIDRYQEMMSTKRPEGDWQEFLDENSFILGLAFGYPVVKVHGQASVGGHKLSGKGETIADFLVKNSLTDNSAIIEIKTPQTRMFNKSPYRNGIYPPSAQLVGAVNQALDQKHNFEGEIAQIKVNSRLFDIETYSVRCCLVVGTMPVEEDRKRSFELFRGNSKHVEIVTFDELLEKLKGLRDLLTSRYPEPKSEHRPFEAPF